MATSLRSLYKSSDTFLDYCCTPCEEDNLKTEAEVYCEKCTTFYCGSCINMHKQLYKKHTTYARSDVKYWPVAKPTRDFIEKCELHTEEKLKLYCEDHEQICCNTCVSLDHRQCTTVNFIKDAVTQSFADLQQLFAEINTMLQQMTLLRKSGEANITSLHELYKKSAQDIHNFRQKINEALDELEAMTTTKLEFAMKTLESDLKTDIDNCSKVYEELNCFKDVMQDISDKNTELVFVACKKWLNKKKQSESLLQRMSTQTGITFSFQTHDSIDTFLSELSGLGTVIQERLVDQDRPLSVIVNSKYSVKTTGDTSGSICGVCCLPDGQLLVTDVYNKSLKLLNKQYQVVSNCHFDRFAYNVCHIGKTDVVVTLEDHKDTGELKYVTVDKGTLVKGKTLQLKHRCVGICHRQGELYITSRRALYKYDLNGKQLKKLYEGSSSENSVFTCDITYNGDKIFVINREDDKLLTLANDGTVLSEFSDPELKSPWGIHVTTAGQVLICCQETNTIMQVHSDGKRKIATMSLEADGIIKPISVFYKMKSASVVVGLGSSLSIVVLKVK